MKLKTVTTLLLLSGSLISSIAWADPIISKMKLDKVTLFLRGAELQESSVIDIPAGESEILLTNLANQVNVNSINVSAGNDVVILSSSLVNNFILDKEDNERVKSLKQTLEQLKNEQDVLKIRITVIDEEIKLLRSNRINELTKTNGSLADAKNVINFVKDNLTTALIEKGQMLAQLSELEQRINNYNNQLYLEEGVQNHAVMAVKVKVNASKAMKLPVNLTYMTQNAGWQPVYDVRVNNINAPVVLVYKANIYQSSGLEWNNIDFSLSTANPIEGNSAPRLNPWNVYINNSSKYNYLSKEANYEAASRISMEVSEDSSSEVKESTPYRGITTAYHNGLNLQYQVKLPYTILSNTQDNILNLKAKEVAANYRYFSIPKVTEKAYLQAQISEWDNLDLLPGEASIFYAGSYIGNSYLTTQGIKETLDISLGIDKEIIVTRKQDKDETSKPSFFGNNVSRKYAYSIDVKNNKAQPIDITIYDQLPIVQNKVVEISDQKYGDALYNKVTGELSWNIHLNGKESKQLPFSFSLTYPNNKSNIIIGL